MKVYISADIEGITGVTDWNETESNKTEYGEFRQQMTKEVTAACRGALNAGASEIWINDAHGSGRNIIAEKLPRQTVLIRGWSEHPYSMMQEIDHSFDAVFMIGYHSRAGEKTGSLAHTYSMKFAYMTINGKPASEFMINSYIAAYHNVPVVFLSGDKAVCREAGAFNAGLKNVSVKRCIGNSTINIHPSRAGEEIEKNAEIALKENLSKALISLPQSFTVKIGMKKSADAYKSSFYPDVKSIDAYTIEFHTRDFFEVMRMLTFVV
jgi:D-amino peptidase